MLTVHAHAVHVRAPGSQCMRTMRSTLRLKRTVSASQVPRMLRMHAAARTDAQVNDNEKENGTHTTAHRGDDAGINPSVYDDMMNGQSGDHQIDWRKKWYAVHPINDLPEDRPWGFRVLGKALVAWKDGDGQWRVFEDACPHRRVPLSEGRKEEDGTLACAYHGWRFDGEGQCTEIPQLEEAFIDRTKPLPKQSCAVSFPVAEASGLLFVFMVPGADGLLESLKVPVPEALEIDDETGSPLQVRMCRPWYAREMPMSFEILMENTADPAHVSFAHHGVAPFLRRDKPSIYPYDTVVDHPETMGYMVGASKFGYAMKGFSRVLSRNVMDQRHFPAMSQNWVYKLASLFMPYREINFFQINNFTVYFHCATLYTAEFPTCSDQNIQLFFIYKPYSGDHWWLPILSGVLKLYEVNATPMRGLSWGGHLRGPCVIMLAMHAEEGEDPDKSVENLLEGTPFMCQTFYLTPVTATTCKVITRGDAHTEKIAKWILADLQPTFMSHLFSESAITDGDMSLLHRQAWEIYHKELSYKDYYMPARSDRGVVQMWKHMKKHSKEGINYYPHTPDTSLLPPEKSLERYHSHVKDCKECSRALKRVEVAIWGFGAVALLATLATSVALARGVATISVLVSGGLGAAASAFVSSKLYDFRKQFYYVPYIHQDR